MDSKMSNSEIKSNSSTETSASKATSETSNDSAVKQCSDAETKFKPTGIKKEIGGREGPDPTRFGDWENKGLAIDF